MQATPTPTKEGMIKLFSVYRDAEIRGAALLMKLMQREKDPEAQVLFSRHIDDETRHAWMWTRRIKQEGGLPVEVPDGYQRQLGKALGIPTSVIDLFALTVVVENRSVTRYKEHAASPICDEATRAVLEEITQDEKWHISWMEDWLYKMGREQGREDEARERLAMYRRKEAEAWESIKDWERGWLGFSFSDSASLQAAQAS
jgi:rubrerythrin